jgi:hypothetical protein
MKDNMLKQRDDGSKAMRWNIMGFRYAPSHYIPAQKPQIVRVTRQFTIFGLYCDELHSLFFANL